MDAGGSDWRRRVASGLPAAGVRVVDKQTWRPVGGGRRGGGRLCSRPRTRHRDGWAVRRGRRPGAFDAYSRLAIYPFFVRSVSMFYFFWR